MQRILGQVRAAVERYQMIEKGDRIAVGVSGGKDSLVLLCTLAQLRAFYPEHFELTAVTVDPGFWGKTADYSSIEELCRRFRIQYQIRRSSLAKVIFEERHEKNPCSLCARMRRGMLHNMAKENGCNKIALGHHFDDAVETFFLNLFYGGKLGCFSPKSYLSRKDLTLIRPMIFCEETQIKSAAARNHLPIVKSSCPADGDTSRQEIKILLKALEKSYPDLRAKVMGAMQRADLDGWGGNSPPDGIRGGYTAVTGILCADSGQDEKST